MECECKSLANLAVLTSGGDAPGMNPCIRAVVRSALARGIKVYGVEDGLQGLIEDRFIEMDHSSVSGISAYGGTILGTARSEEFMTPEGRAKAAENIRRRGIEALVILGGDGSFRGGSALSMEQGIPFVGLPCTIDNDMYGTDFTIGFQTALDTIVEAVDKVRDTARSHHRLFFVETMGRHCGDLAVAATLASGADATIIPETETDLEALAHRISLSFEEKKHRSFIVIVAEGDEAGDAIAIERKVRDMCGIKGRVVVLGHVQRGGSPVAQDRIMATALGYYAVDALCQGRRNVFLGIENDTVVSRPIEDVLGKKNPIKADAIRLAQEMCR